jgi:hypothetical protein
MSKGRKRLDLRQVVIGNSGSRKVKANDPISELIKLSKFATVNGTILELHIADKRAQRHGQD